MKEKDPKVKSCLNPGCESIQMPLMTTAHFLERQGIRKKGLQVAEDKNTGQLWFGIYTAISRAAGRQAGAAVCQPSSISRPPVVISSRGARALCNAVNCA